MWPRRAGRMRKVSSVAKTMASPPAAREVEAAVPCGMTTGCSINISRIVGASSRVAGVLFGAEDYTADLGIKRTVDGEELLYARSKIAVTCRAFGIEAIDTPFVDLQDTEGLIRDTGKARALGMTGKAAIHPRQVKVIHEVLNPSPEEIRHAQIIARAMEQAEKEGKAVISLDDKMIDAPVAARAKKILLMAELAGLYEE